MKFELDVSIDDIWVRNGIIFIRVKCGYSYKVINYSQCSEESDKIQGSTTITKIQSTPPCCKHKKCRGFNHCRMRIK